MHKKNLLAMGALVLLLGAEVFAVAPAGYVKTFEDHFDGSVLNTNNWTVGLKDPVSGHMVPGAAGQGLLNSAYCGYITPEDVSVSNGCVFLQNQKRTYVGTDPAGTYQYTSGWIMSMHKVFINKGYIEYRAKFPSGDKVWPALWLVAEDRVWGPEWDMWEYFGYRADVGYDNMGLHLCYDEYPNEKWSSAWLKPFNTGYTNSAWHVYGFQWTATNAVWTIDGVVKRTLLYNTITNSLGASLWPDENMYFILNNGERTSSPDATTTWPNNVIIDYMTIYQPAALVTNALLCSLVPGSGALAPSFASTTFSYTVNVPYTITNMTVTPTAQGVTGSIKVNGTVVASGDASAPIALNIGTNTIYTVVISPSLTVTNTYTLSVVRAAEWTGGSGWSLFDVPERRAMWVWSMGADSTNSRNWDGVNSFVRGLENYKGSRDLFLDFCENKSIRSIYVFNAIWEWDQTTLDAGHIPNEAAWTGLMADATSRGIQVWMMGYLWDDPNDSRLTLATNKQALVRIMQAIAAFNQAHPTTPIAGFHNDQEPGTTSVYDDLLDILKNAQDWINTNAPTLLLSQALRPVWRSQNVTWNGNTKTMNQHIIDVLGHAAYMAYSDTPSTSLNTYTLPACNYAASLGTSHKVGMGVEVTDLKNAWTNSQYETWYEEIQAEPVATRFLTNSVAPVTFEDFLHDAASSLCTNAGFDRVVIHENASYFNHWFGMYPREYILSQSGGAYISTNPPAVDLCRDTRPLVGLGPRRRISAWILSGQSNAEGYGITENPVVTLEPNSTLAGIGRSDLNKPHNNVRFYQGTNEYATVTNSAGMTMAPRNRWHVMTPYEGTTYDWGTGIGNESGRRFGPELSFGYAMQQWLGDEIAIIKYARASASIGSTAEGPNGGVYNDYDPSDSRLNQYDKLVNTISNAVASLPAGDTLLLRGVLWMQGEGDANATLAGAYQTNLTEFIAALRTSIANIAAVSSGKLVPESTWGNLKIFIGTIATQGANGDTVRAAQSAVAAADPNVCLVNGTTGLSLMTIDDWWGSGIHYDTAGQVTLGERFFGMASNSVVSAIGLANLVTSSGTLSPSFASTTFTYTVNVPHAITNMTVTPTAAEAGAAVRVNGNLVTSGTPYGPISLSIGTNVITTIVVPVSLARTNTYTLKVIRSAITGNVYTVTYNGNGSTGGTVPIDSWSYTNGETVTVLGNVGNLVRAGYRYAGWNTAAGGTGSAYSGGSTFAMGSTNITLFAQWATNYPPVVNAGTNQVLTLGASTPWTPSNLTVAAWFDAADSNTVTVVSGAVSQWNDKSGNGRNATNSTPANRPQYVSGALNGLPTVDFDGTSDVLGVGGSGFGVWSFFVVFNAEDANNSFLNWSWVFGSKGSPDVPVLYAGQGSAGVGSQLPTKTAPASNIGLNGTVIGGSSVSLGTITNFHLLDNVAGSASPSRTNWKIGNGDGYWNGKIAELIAISNAVTVADRQSVQGYLANKWGLTSNLPTNHPYKSVAPGQASVVTSLDGTVSDPNGDTLTAMWSVVSGPGVVTFGSSNAVDTTATFTAVGTYVLRLTVSDPNASTSDDMVITVLQTGFTAIGAVPYVWLATWTNNFEVTVTNDWDSDGFTTVQEYWSGTDPMNSNSFFSIDSIINNGTNLVLKWRHAQVDPVIPPICIQAKSNLLNGGWSFAGQVQPVNGTNIWMTTNLVNGFYRLCVTNTL
jgi:beta-glucanase (GH16 family)